MVSCSIMWNNTRDGGDLTRASMVSAGVTPAYIANTGIDRPLPRNMR